MRTIKRHALELNAGKRGTLERIAADYAAEKQHWLGVFQVDIAAIGVPDKVRNAARQAGYKSPLPGVVWPLALKGAAETMDKYWQALFVDIRRRVARNGNLDDEQRRYAYQILKHYGKLAALLAFEDIEDAKLGYYQRKQVRNYLNRIIRRARGKPPRVKLARSFVLDKCSYTIKESDERQYIVLSKALTGMGSKLAIPLKGYTDLTRRSSRPSKDGKFGRARPEINVVLRESGVEIHYSAATKSTADGSGRVVAVDAGYTEVLVDSDGEHHGEGFGEIMTAATEQCADKGKKRNKLRALAEKYEARGQHKKARNIRRYNLGTKKLDATRQRRQATVECHINRALNAVIKKADVLVSEDLSHSFDYKRSKKWNRRLSAWARGVIKDRIEFKASVGCSHREQVNPAYSSQMCPSCGYVDQRNRNGDRFQCTHCGYMGQSDEVAALNLLSRFGDSELSRYMPYQRVRAVLDERFQRRRESDAATGVVDSPPFTPGLETRHEQAPGRLNSGVNPRANKKSGLTTLGEI